MSPIGISFVPVSISRILQIVSDIGRPIDPNFLNRLLVGLIWVTGEVSVRPYPSKRIVPVTASNALATSGGSGAAHELHMLTDDRSYFPTSGWVAIPAYRAGTQLKTVPLVFSNSFSKSERGGLPDRGSGIQTS